MVVVVAAAAVGVVCRCRRGGVVVVVVVGGGGGGGIVVPGPGCQGWCRQLVHAGVVAGSSSPCLEGCDNELVVG